MANIKKKYDRKLFIYRKTSLVKKGSILFHNIRIIQPLSTLPITVVCLLGLVFPIWEIPGYSLQTKAGYFALRFSWVSSVPSDTTGRVH